MSVKSSDKTPVEGIVTYSGKFEYKIRSTKKPYNAKKQGVVKGEIRVKGDDVYLYETGGPDADRPDYIGHITAAKSLFTDHEYDINWTTDRKLVVGGTGVRKLIVDMHRFADDSPQPTDDE